MTLEQFAANMNRQPFRPFTLVLTSGNAITIDAPEFACITRSGSTITFYNMQGRVVIDTANVMAIRTERD